MEEQDRWSDIFAALQRIEDVKADLAAAREHRDKVIAEIHQNGVPVAQIARRIGMSRPAIHTIIKQQDVKD